MSLLTNGPVGLAISGVSACRVNSIDRGLLSHCFDFTRSGGLIQSLTNRLLKEKPVAV